MLQGKTLVVGVTGGIAAYKAVEVVSRLRKLGADVHVIMTSHATHFVAPLTFQAVSHHAVHVNMFDEPDAWDIRHISLAERADLVVIAPATANVLGKMAHGIADDMLTTTVMAVRAPILLVPAMNTAMYENPVVQGNIERLKGLGHIFMEPDSGLMACGTVGQGRLPEPEAIVARAVELLQHGADMTGLRVMVTAGPTREALDPVRYLSNHSSGKMGYAVATVAAQRGARVTLISGPVHLPHPRGVQVVDVVSAQEMHDTALLHYEENDVLIMVAAVADYRCATVSREKIKKSQGNRVLELTENPDIARELGAVKGHRMLIGFSAETEDLFVHAAAKLESKNLDLIVANDVTLEGAGFGSDTNVVRLIHRNGTFRDVPRMPKEDVAREILDEILEMQASRRRDHADALAAPRRILE